MAGFNWENLTGDVIYGDARSVKGFRRAIVLLAMQGKIYDDPEIWSPFSISRLRQDSELLLSRSTHNWSQQDLQQLSSSSNSIGDNNSSESTSSTETLKWLGSMSDVSEASHATSMSALSSAGKCPDIYLPIITFTFRLAVVAIAS